VTVWQQLVAHIRSQLRDFAHMDCCWTMTATRCRSRCGDVMKRAWVAKQDGMIW
jgi:hypothetical protein